MGIDPATAVMTSNFIGDALEMCRELDFRGCCSSVISASW